MKILMIDSLVGNDYSICLCNSLKKAGIDIELLVTEDRNIKPPINFPVKKWAPSKNSEKSKLIKPFILLKYLTQIFLYAAKNRNTILHYQFFRKERVEWLFFLLLRLTNAKLVHTAHNVLPHNHQKGNYFFKYIIYKSAGAIIVHSKFVKNKLVKQFNINAHKVEVIPHGNFDNYLPAELITKKAARESLKFSKSDDVLLFFGFIKEYKGLDLLLEAFQIAAGNNHQLKLVIAGKPASKGLEDHYRKRIADLSFNGHILYYPRFIPSDALPAFFAAADVVVLPYKKIDHSGIVHLGYSFGKPLIATNVGDFSEIIEQDKSGYIVEKNNAENLAQTISDAFSDKQHLENMGNFAKQLSNTKYSWDDIANKTIALYETFANTR